MAERSSKNFFIYILFIACVLILFNVLEKVFHWKAFDHDRPTPPKIGESVRKKEKGENAEKMDTVSFAEQLNKINNESVTEVQENEASVVTSNNITSEESKKLEAYFSSLIESYKKDIIAEIPPTKNRTDIVIRYYPHDLDNQRVLSLKNYRLYLHERPSNFCVENCESNAIYYGSNVKSEDVKLVAYTLLKNGMPLKKIAKSKYGWKENALEIDMDSTLVDVPVITLKEISEFKNSSFDQ